MLSKDQKTNKDPVPLREAPSDLDGFVISLGSTPPSQPSEDGSPTKREGSNILDTAPRLSPPSPSPDVGIEEKLLLPAASEDSEDANKTPPKAQNYLAETPKRTGSDNGEKSATP